MLLDELDLKLMEALEEDSRQPVQTLAKKLGKNRTTINYRLNRLLDNNIVTIACISEAEQLDYQFRLVIGINTKPGKSGDVAEILKPVSSIKVISLTAGRYSILIWAIVRDQKELTQFVSRTLTAVPEIVSVEIINSFHWVLDSWSYFTQKAPSQIEKGSYRPEELDRIIIKTLQSDPRQSCAELAKKIGCSKQAAKNQLEKLVKEKVIRFVSIVDSTALGYEMRVMLMIKTRANRIESIAQELSRHRNTRHVSLITGQWQVFAEAEFKNSGHMHHYLSENLNNVPGVLEYEIIHIAKTVKLSTDFF